MHFEKLSILVLESSNTLTSLLSRTLGTLCKKPRLIEADNADDVIIKINARGSYDFILLDWELAAKAHLLKKIRQIDTKVLIILSTFEYTIAKRDLSIKAGANNCIQKPFQTEEFFQMITETRKAQALATIKQTSDA